MKKKPPDWKLGTYEGKSDAGFAEQRIDFQVNGNGQHFGKIIVYDVRCRQIAAKILKFLNQP